MNEIAIFTGNSNPELAEKICRYLDIPLGKVSADQHPHWVLRLQFDNYWINALADSYTQYTAQVVYRFE